MDGLIGSYLCPRCGAKVLVLMYSDSAKCGECGYIFGILKPAIVDS